MYFAPKPGYGPAFTADHVRNRPVRIERTCNEKV